MTDKISSGSAGQHRGHETSDAAPGWRLLFGAGLAMLTLFALLSMGWMFHYLENRIAGSAVPLSPLSDTERQPPEPRLQVNPAQDLRRLAETESRRLNSYDWVDRQAGLVRIPIGRAIQIVAEKGLPAQYEEWLGGTAVAAPQTTAAIGEKLFLQYGCNTCHLPDDQSRAPSLQGLFGRDVHLQGADTLVADESYIRESILNPQARVVEGFFPIMPPYQGHVSEEEVLQIIAYIRSLRTSTRTNE